MSSDRQTGGLLHEIEKRKKFATWVAIGQFCFSVGLIMGRYAPQLYEMRTAVIPPKYLISLSFSASFALGVLLNFGYFVVALYYVLWTKDRLDQIGEVDV